MVGFAVSRQAALHELLREAGTCSVSLLAAGQEDVAAHFARGVPPIAHWTGIATRDSELGPPLIADAVAWLECRTWAEYDAGDHTIFVGEVVRAERNERREPLVYIESSYRSL